MEEKMISKLSYQPILRLTVTATESLPAQKFISIAGGLCTGTQKALGVSDYPVLNGEQTSVIAIGTAIVRASGTIAKGAVVSADSSGNAKAIESGETPLGIAISPKVGDFVEVLITH